MKNYLFAPFRDDDDWAETWNSCKSGIDQGIMIFLGRVESTHDVIISELKAEKDGLLEESNLLKAELQAVNDKDGLYDEVKELQAENKRNVVKFEMRVETLKNEVEEGRVENRRLMKQVSSNRGNSSSTHTHTISNEIAEYMSHNEGCGGARMFLIPRDEFKHGEYDNTIYWDDGVE